MLKLGKLVLALVVLVIALRQLYVYYQTVVMGTFFGTAPFPTLVMQGVLWPVVVIVIAYAVIRAIIKFKPE